MDAELVLRFRAGQDAAFEDLVRRHRKEAYGFCLRLTGRPEEAEELSQEGFVKAFRALSSFRGDSAFRSWLFRILINLHRDRLRRHRREETRLRSVQMPVVSSPVSGEEVRELGEKVQNQVQRLPDRQREVLVLHVYQGLDYREISSILGCSYDDVKVNLSLARKRLKQALAEYL